MGLPCPLKEGFRRIPSNWISTPDAKIGYKLVKSEMREKRNKRMQILMQMQFAFAHLQQHV